MSEFATETSDNFKQQKTVACLTSLVYACFPWKSSKHFDKKHVKFQVPHTLTCEDDETLFDEDSEHTKHSNTSPYKR